MAEGCALCPGDHRMLWERSGSRRLALVPPPVVEADEDGASTVPVVEPGLADVVTLGRRRAAQVSEADEESFFADTLAEYQWARDVSGLAPSTLDQLVKPVIEVCQHYGTMPWRLTSRQVDLYFAGPGK